MISLERISAMPTQSSMMPEVLWKINSDVFEVAEMSLCFCHLILQTSPKLQYYHNYDFKSDIEW